jgi:aspartate carbamoyltransferase catalytic subunit
MRSGPDIDSEIRARLFAFPTSHFLSADDLDRAAAERLLALADAFAELNRRAEKRIDLLRGRTLVNLFFENSTRTQSSFELAGKRLGADVLSLNPRTSSMAKGETLADTAATLDAMQVDLMAVRHSEEGAPGEIARVVGAAVLNAGDGKNEHPTQALLDALTLQRAFGRVEGLTVAICGDVRHSRVARSNLRLLRTLGATVRLVAPASLSPEDAAAPGVAVMNELRAGVAGADVVMMLRLQLERMETSLAPSREAYSADWGLTRDILALANPGARVMHPGPMNRGVEIESEIADDPAVSLVLTQVELGVSARMAVMAALDQRRQAGR